MGRKNHWQLAVALGFALGLLAGCEQKGPAQKAGENVDKAVDQAGKAMQKTGETAKEAEKKVKEATK